ncbi:MAG: hypothetical protein NT031_15955 [Planctomycetota bacterium]|nr:hypothetical protein [Planctomycetota bacterium]
MGGELFAQGQTPDDGQGILLANFGGQYTFTKNVSLLFSVGHSLLGERHQIGYAGLYWTW